MNDRLTDAEARERFRLEWDRNFAVSANAGSGKTTAISERLAAIALSPRADELLRKTAVVTYTRKAAAQIGQRARAILLRRLRDRPDAGLAALDHLERTFFGTIHSFCLLLAQRHGIAHGLHRNPEVVADDSEWWDEFLEQDAMEFHSLAPDQVTAFLRHVPLDSVFALSRQLSAAQAKEFVQHAPTGGPPAPDEMARAGIAAATTRGSAQAALRRNQDAAEKWLVQFRGDRRFLPLPVPEGSAGGIVDLYARLLAPLKSWLADAGAVLAAELARRYRDWRIERGVQTYADQVDAAISVLRDPDTLDQVRAEGWRVLLDEAQDTDPQQFSVLVEIVRPPGSPYGTWPGDGPAPGPGRFSLVGDGQQSIYGGRANLRNFRRHLDGFLRSDGCECLTFGVTFRVPCRVVDYLNETLAPVFGPERPANSGLPEDDDAPAPVLQVKYEPLVAAPSNAEGSLVTVPLPAMPPRMGVDERLAREAEAIAACLSARGPQGVGAAHWGDICLLAPRNEWLPIVRDAFEAAGIRTSLQTRRSRNGDRPAYAWAIGLLTVLVDPENTFEWVGVLREIFAVSDARLAGEFAEHKRFFWDDPARHEAEVAEALRRLRPWIDRAYAEGESLDGFVAGLFQECELREKARRIDAGDSVAELARLLAEAAELGLTGAGPSQWLDKLRRELDDGRPAGKASDEAVNLLTSHSAKGLEWPVVIPVGLWRGILRRTSGGLQLVTTGSARPRIYFDAASLPDDTRESQRRESLREDARLLYVTLTRARRTLILPWGPEFAPPATGSFSVLWGADLSRLPTVDSLPVVEAAPPAADLVAVAEVGWLAAPKLPSYPIRLLPHQLAVKPDTVRQMRHESGDLEPAPRPAAGAEPLEYGTWWHETMEFMPWREEPAAREDYLENALTVAAGKGFADQARADVALLLRSKALSTLTDVRWQSRAEMSLLAEVSPGAWVDGVVDLLLHDPGREILVVDWKTNRLLPGETPEALLARLRTEYVPQLEAYRNGLRQLFPDTPIQVAIYAASSGEWAIW